MKRTLLLALLVICAACDLGPFGATRLTGQAVDQPVDDWSFVAGEYSLPIETRAPAWLPAATTWFFVHDKTLWLYAMAPRSFEYGWVRRLREVDPGVRILFGGKLYAGRASLITDPMVIDPLLPIVVRKYHMVETSNAHLVEKSDAETQMHQWFFRVDSQHGR